MTKRWVSTAKGRHLAGRAKTNTMPEIQLRKAVHAAGGRFRLHRQIAKGCTPDFVLPGRRLAIFVDGCFWHNCPEHGHKAPWSGPNAALWAEKMRLNKERDDRSTRLAEQAGWHVLRIRECDIGRDVDMVAARLLGTPSESPQM